MNLPEAMPADDISGPPVTPAEAAEVCVVGALQQIKEADLVLATDSLTLDPAKLFASAAATYVTVRDEVTKLAMFYQSAGRHGMPRKHIQIAQVVGEMGLRLARPGHDLNNLLYDGQVLLDSDPRMVEFGQSMKMFMETCHFLLHDKTKKADRPKIVRRFINAR